MQIVQITLPYPPSANSYWKIFKNRMYVTREAKEYKKRVAKELLEMGIKPRGGDISISICVYRPQRRGDLDNTFAVLLDSLNKTLWTDDGNIVALAALRFDDKDRPRAEIACEFLSQ